jgi:serine/threonine protein kinase
MTDIRTLQAGDRVAHYRVVGPLGAGGMGEVYLAQDQKLERNVALKVLPPALIQNEERVRRFVQEAKSASSLNHPNIITIYEIGEEQVTSGDGETSPEPIRYISMELVNGRTLGTKIHEENTDLRTLLRYLAQAADGIAKAHAAGIVHRDLKPGNIMVTEDGFAKVLDFGLAKLTERNGPEVDATITAATANADQTAAGSVLGTVHYMSPEQVQGKVVDHRSDVFSFGCILYEAATRRRPFQGESGIETMHAILHDRPTPIEEINAEAPNELRRLIRRCLKKSPERRLQSMKDLALELSEIVDEYHELSNSGTTMSSATGAAAPIASRRSPLLPAILVGALVIAAAAYFGLRGGSAPTSTEPFTKSRITTATRSGGVRASTMSRDGRYLAYVNVESGHVAMYVRQIATGTDVQVVPPTDRPLRNLQFSPDGNYLYYTSITPDTPRYWTLYRIPSLGGQPEKRGFDVDSPVTFSPDGQEMAFARYLPGGSATIQIMPTRGGEPRELIRFAEREDLQPDLDWSPDGRSLAALVFHPPPEPRGDLVTVDVAEGTRTVLCSRAPAMFQGVAWMPDGRGLVMTGIDPQTDTAPQAFHVSYPDGVVRRITNDMNAYFEPAVSDDGLVALTRESSIPDIWTIDPDGHHRILVRGTSADTAPTSFAVGADVVVYAQPWQDTSRLYVQGPADDTPRILPTSGGLILDLACGGSTVFFSTLEPQTGQFSLWSVGLDGTGLKQLEDASATFMAASPDGRYIIYVLAEEPDTQWLRDMESGATRRITDSTSGVGALVSFSPDGSRVLISLNDDSGPLVRTVYKIFPVAGDGPPRVVEIPGNNVFSQWIPGENAVAYVDVQDPARNLWRLPLDGGEPTRLTAFASGQRIGTDFSPDGRHLVVTLRDEDGDNFWLFEDGSLDPTRITSFVGKTSFGASWLGDSTRLVATVGVRARDVVLVRESE